jgi:hypothetical protein
MIKFLFKQPFFVFEQQCYFIWSKIIILKHCLAEDAPTPKISICLEKSLILAEIRIFPFCHVARAV